MRSSQYLLNKLTALENVTLSMDIANVHQNDKEVRAIELLEKVGLDQDQIHRRILKLSGAQQQRVAIARALSYDPKIILADEPTGNLDSDTWDEIMDIFDVLKEQGKCIIIVTHSKKCPKEPIKYMHYKKESVGIFQRFYCNIYILSSINRITFRTNCTLTKSLTLCPVVSNSIISIMGKEYLSNSSFLIGV
ncbi:ATP-binding cassette domain-containing protein [Holdemanella biformis]|uniref:ATP-binding cassette domain-containing protein n=2 Tax=Holdemanella biformis TaxID=1735 RepID=UPI0020CAEC26